MPMRPWTQSWHVFFVHQGRAPVAEALGPEVLLSGLRQLL